MSPLRRPVVGGVAGGAATSLVAALIGAVDAGRVSPGEAVDVLVCRSVSYHLSLATRIAAGAPVPPVVVISADAPGKAPHQVRDRARILEPNVPALLWLPWIEQLRSMADPPKGLRAACLDSAPAPWVSSARAVRDQLIVAVTELLSPAADVAGMGGDELDGDEVGRVTAAPLRRTS